MRVLSAALVSAAFAARYPNHAPDAVGGTIESINAAEENAGSIQAAAVVGFQSNPGKLEWVKANEHFLASGQIVHKGDYVQLKQDTAKMLVANGRAEIVTEDEVQKAQAEASKAKK